MINYHIPTQQHAQWKHAVLNGTNGDLLRRSIQGRTEIEYDNDAPCSETKFRMIDLPILTLPNNILDVVVAFVQSPHEVYVQLKDQEESIREIMAEVDAYCQSDTTIFRNPPPGSYCFAQYPLDNCWYRARLLGRPEVSKMKVYFIDYGNTEMVNTKCVKKMTAESRAHPPMAFPVLINGLGGGQEITEDLKSAIENQTVIIKIIGKSEGNEGFVVDMFLDDSSDGGGVQNAINVKEVLPGLRQKRQTRQIFDLTKRAGEGGGRLGRNNKDGFRSEPLPSSFTNMGNNNRQQYNHRQGHHHSSFNYKNRPMNFGGNNRRSDFDGGHQPPHPGSGGGGQQRQSSYQSHNNFNGGPSGSRYYADVPPPPLSNGFSNRGGDDYQRQQRFRSSPNNNRRNLPEYQQQYSPSFAAGSNNFSQNGRYSGNHQNQTYNNGGRGGERFDVGRQKRDRFDGGGSSSSSAQSEFGRRLPPPPPPLSQMNNTTNKPPPPPSTSNPYHHHRDRIIHSQTFNQQQHHNRPPLSNHHYHNNAPKSDRTSENDTTSGMKSKEEGDGVADSDDCCPPAPRLFSDDERNRDDFVGRRKIRLHHLEGPREIFLTLVDWSDLHDRVQTETEEVEKQAVTTNVEIGMKCLALFDDVWYRVEVVRILPDTNECEVFYFDYGNRQTVNQSELRNLPTDNSALMQIHRLCFQCAIEGLEDLGKSDELENKLRELIDQEDGHECDMVIKGFYERNQPVYSVQIASPTGESVTDAILEWIKGDVIPSVSDLVLTGSGSDRDTEDKEDTCMTANDLLDVGEENPTALHHHHIIDQKILQTLATGDRRQRMTGIICHIESLWNEFCFQPNDWKTIALRFSDQAAENPTKLANPKIGDFCFIKWDDSEEKDEEEKEEEEKEKNEEIVWNRVKIVSIKEEMATLFFIDFGNVDDKSVNELYQIPSEEMLRCHSLAIRCRLDTETIRQLPDSESLPNLPNQEDLEAFVLEQEPTVDLTVLDTKVTKDTTCGQYVECTVDMLIEGLPVSQFLAKQYSSNQEGLKGDNLTSGSVEDMVEYMLDKVDEIVDGDDQTFSMKLDVL